MKQESLIFISAIRKEMFKSGSEEMSGESVERKKWRTLKSVKSRWTSNERKQDERTYLYMIDTLHFSIFLHRKQLRTCVSFVAVTMLFKKQRNAHENSAVSMILHV